MAIRNIINDQNKSWLNGNFNTLNANQIDLGNTNEMVIVAGSIINLQGSAGSIGQILKKDVSNIPAWVTYSPSFGSFEEKFTEYDSTTFTTTSLTLVVASTYTTASLPAGNYVLHYSVEMKNLTSSAHTTIEDASAVPAVQEWQINGLIDEFHSCSGFYQFPAPLSGVQVFTVETLASAGTTTLQKVRFQLYRIS